MQGGLPLYKGVFTQYGAFFECLGVFIRYILYAFAVYNRLVVETGFPDKRVLHFFIVRCQNSFLKIYNSSISHSIGFFSQLVDVINI